MGAKLAFARLSFNYFISEAVFDYVVDAVHLVADEGWKLLPLYRFDPDTGLWHHRDGLPAAAAEPAAALRRRRRRASPPRPRACWPASSRRRGGSSRARGRGRRRVRSHDPALSEEFERIRWFPLPGEGLAPLRASQA